MTSAWPAPTDGFPWATFVVNVAGALVLGVVVALAVGLPPNRYLRPLLGTGFCGGLTTFSSVAVSVDELVAHHHAGTAGLYLLGTVGAGLASAAAGLVVGRSVVANRERGGGGRR